MRAHACASAPPAGAAARAPAAAAAALLAAGALTAPGVGAAHAGGVAHARAAVHARLDRVARRFERVGRLVRRRVVVAVVEAHGDRGVDGREEAVPRPRCGAAARRHLARGHARVCAHVRPPFRLRRGRLGPLRQRHAFRRAGNTSVSACAQRVAAMPRVWHVTCGSARRDAKSAVAAALHAAGIARNCTRASVLASPPLMIRSPVLRWPAARLAVIMLTARSHSAAVVRRIVAALACA